MPCINVERTGENIREMRKAAGMTIRDVATACGITPQAVAKWGHCMPTIDAIIVMAHMWNVKVEDIVAVDMN